MQDLNAQAPGHIVENAAARPRDPRVAEFQEFEAARQKNTRQALELFLARHPKSPYAASARQLLETLKP